MDKTGPPLLSTHLNEVAKSGLLDEFHVEFHRPKAMLGEPHLHLMLEVNYLIGCEMTYQFGQSEFVLPANRFCVFWGIAPHKVSRVRGEGKVINAYFPLNELIEFGHPKDFTKRLMCGEVLIANHSTESDVELVKRWGQHQTGSCRLWRSIHRKELQIRLMRMFAEGCTTILENSNVSSDDNSLNSYRLVLARALQFIHLSYDWKLTVDEIADEVGLSRSQLAKLFKATLGIHPKGYLTALRIKHAKAMLTETRKSVISIMGATGFETTSAFYEAFKRETGMSPGQYRKGGCMSAVDTKPQLDE